MRLYPMLVVPSLVLNAMPSAREVSRVSPAVVSEIRAALTSNRPELVLQHLHDNGLSINSQLTEKNEAVLHLVAQLGKQEIAEKLLAQGMRVNVRDREGKTPLIYAQDNGHTDLAELLQTYTQAELAVLQNTTKPQDLFAAAANNDRAGAELLLAEGADPHEKKHHGKSTYNQLGFKTPFHIAFEAEHYSLAAFLLKEAQGINGLDERGWTPLMLAIVADDWDMVRELLRDGADIFAGYHRSSPIQNALDVAQAMESEAQLVDIFVEEKGADGVVHTYGETWPFIELASERGHTEIVKLLREQGAEFNNEKAMLSAMYRNNGERVLTLIEDKAKLIDVFIAAKGVDGTIGEIEDTLLILAANGGHTEVVELLLEYGADINTQNRDRYTALMQAARYGHKEIVELLIERGADINTQNGKGNSAALMQAARYGHKEIVELLIERGANINTQDRKGNIVALIQVARYGHKEMVLPQLEEGSLHHAAAHGDVDTVAALLSRGVDVNIVDTHGWTALHYAVFMEQEAMVQQLCDNDAYAWYADTSGSTIFSLASRAFGNDAPIVQILGRFTYRQLNESWLHYYVRRGKTAKAINYIEAQANPQEFVRTKQSSTGISLASALHVAAKYGDLELFRYLTEEMGLPIDHEVLIKIAIGGYINIAHYLLSRGVKIKHVEKKGSFTLLHYAAWHGNLAMVELLVELGADVNTLAEHDHYRAYDLSPLEAAARDDNNLPIVQFLVEKGAKIDHSSNDYRNVRQRTVLDWAKKSPDRAHERRDGRVWEFLYAKGLEQGKFLHEAVGELRIDDVKRLIAQGVDANAQNHKGLTPLQVVAGVGRRGHWVDADDADEPHIRTEIAKILIAGGADVNLGRSRTWKPLLQAIRRQRIAMIEHFLSNGADVSVTLSNGEDALQLAQENYHKDNSDVARLIVELVEKHANNQHAVAK